MKWSARIIAFSVDRPGLTTGTMAAVTVVLALLAVLPTLFPQALGALSPITVDTDPENMLSQDEHVRVFHHEMKEALSLYDMVVLGVVNEKHPNGVFNPQSLRNVYELTEFAKTLHWPDPHDPERSVGVVEVDLIAPSTVDNIQPEGLGVVRFEWLMPEPPRTDEEALAVRDKAQRIPFLQGTLVSEDGKALAIYLPLTSKDLSHRIYTELRKKIATLEGDDEYHITGLPVAEDTFGVEMFKQMAVSAPLAMVVIFFLMLLFFRKLVLIVSPLIVAMVSVIVTMALLVVTGNTIHIMSSMIPIFIMPIAVLDSIHILSEFFERYQHFKDRKAAIQDVMRTLFTPMLYTSLTSAAGFISLAVTPIPPVVVFGTFVAIGVMLAWLLTIVFVPAYVMFIPERSLANFGARQEGEHGPHGMVGWVLRGLDRFTYRRAKWILAAAGLAVVVAGYGISRIQINDNPIRWFEPAHPIRVADRVLNEHFGGTYMAYLALRPAEEDESLTAYSRELETRLAEAAPALGDALAAETGRLAAEAGSKEALWEGLEAFVAAGSDAAEGDAVAAWDEALFALDAERQRGEVFKQPEVLRYIEDLQRHLLTTGVVGKSNSLADIVRTVHRELFEGAEERFVIPDSSRGVAQTLITYESSHRPQDLWHFVTPDYRTSSVWIQLRSGDNKDMSKVVDAVAAYMADNPPPAALQPEWFGLTYINVIWQEKMVWGMLQSFLGSFLVVLFMMVVLFRSGLWGLLSMIPLTITIGLIYGVIGLIGKDYDMPVAVLSSLTLGLAIDFAIHFLARSREMFNETPSWAAVHKRVFGEPALAITRNVVVIAVGFLPLLAAPLVPYQTVGVFMAAILLASGVATLLILPALQRVLEAPLFGQIGLSSVTCRCATCVVASATLIAAVAVNVYQFVHIGWLPTTLASLAALPVLSGVCILLSRRRECQAAPAPTLPEIQH